MSVTTETVHVWGDRAVDAAPAPGDAARGGREIADFAGVEPLAHAEALAVRHPEDGLALARPYPLGRAGRRALRGLIRLMCPADGAPCVEPMMERLELQIRTMLRYMPRPVAWAVRAAIVVVDHSPRLLLASHRRLSGLDPAAGARVLRRLASSRLAPVRELIAALRGLVLSSYFDQDEVHEAIDYAPGTFLRARIALRQRLLAGGSVGPADMIPAPAGAAPHVTLHTARR